MDLAEVVEDLICTFEGSGDTTMDTLAMFVFGWILAALFVLWLGRLLYSRFSQPDPKKNDPILPSETTKTKKSKTTDSIDSKPSSRRSSTGAVQRTGSLKGTPGYVPPTPPVRKRVTRPSPGPELRKPRYIPAPQCTGPDNIVVLWVNDVFQWLYNDLVIVNELVDVWINALNEYAKKAGIEQGIEIEIVRMLPEINPPIIGNIFAEGDSKDDITITLDCEANPAFQLKSIRLVDEKTEISHYRVNLNRFRARMNVFCVSEKLQADVKCDGWPEIKVALAPVGSIKNNLDEQQLQEVIIDMITNAIRNSEVHFNLHQYPTCPKLIRHIDFPSGFYSPRQQIYDQSTNSYATSTPNHLTRNTPSRTRGERRLLVKVIRANQLAQGCKEPYCVIEMDEPAQKNQTSVQKNSDSPFWDEHFLFDLTRNTAEVLFEIYDHAPIPAKFLGLGIVGVEELLINPSQRQIISLQSRPYESDTITGTLTVEFLFIEGADVPNIEGSSPYKIKENISPIRPQSRPQSMHAHESLTNGHNQAMKNHYTDMDSSPKNTLVIHSMQRQPSQRLVKVELNNGSWKEVERIDSEETANTDEDIENTKDFLEKEKSEAQIEGTDIEKTNGDAENDVSTNLTNGKSEPVTNGTTTGNNNDSDKDSNTNKTTDYSATGTLPPQPPGTNTTTNNDSRGRPKKRRDFFGTIKRRLGKSKNRSKSAGPGENVEGRDDSLNRSVSADRSRNIDSRLNVPGQRSMDETSRRSSLSEASGLSQASGRTYINEASTLVLETLENGIKKHYLVPLSLAQKSKWKKKGTKLHIYNDHTFIARHLSGGIVCQVCSKNIARRIGKQGYQCRDCQFTCHKHCHVKVNDTCPTSNIHNIELSMLPVLSE